MNPVEKWIYNVKATTIGWMEISQVHWFAKERLSPFSICLNENEMQRVGYIVWNINRLRFITLSFLFGSVFAYAVHSTKCETSQLVMICDGKIKRRVVYYKLKIESHGDERNICQRNYYMNRTTKKLNFTWKINVGQMDMWMETLKCIAWPIDR